MVLSPPPSKKNQFHIRKSLRVLTTDGATDRDEPVPLHHRQRHVQHLAADIVKEAVGLALQRILEVLGERVLFVVDARVRAERHDKVALFFPARNAHDALAPDDVFGDLHERHADGAGGARDEERVLGLEVHLAERAGPGGLAGEAEAAKRDPGGLAVNVAGG
jgi:hypothetical protein